MSSSWPCVQLDRSRLEEMTAVFQEADFTRAGVDFRFFGETHSPDAPHLISWFIELDSEDGARSALDWLEADVMKPCPHSCATRVSSFDVESIGDARSVRRIATAEDIEAAGTEEEVPQRELLGGVHDRFGHLHRRPAWTPGSVSEAQVLEIAGAYHDRLKGAVSGTGSRSPSRHVR